MAEAELDDEVIEKDCSDNNVLNKYVEAGRIAQDVLLAVVAKAKDTGDVLELCAFGDEMVTARTKKLV